MSIIIDQNSAGNIDAPSAGSSTIFVDQSGQLAVKQANGTSGSIPTVSSSNTQVIYNNQGNLAGSSSLTYNDGTGILTGTGFSGNGALLTSITGANVTGAVPYATTANSVAGSNVSGAVSYATTANSVAGANVSGVVSAASSASYAVSAGSATTAGTVTASAQPNITSLGTISLLNVGGNLDVSGNINVTGNLNYSNVNDLIVSDPLIYLGANNTGDLVDIGLVGSYNEGTYYHTGIARNHTTNAWTFFDGLVTEPTTVIDWANATYPNVKAGYFIGNGSQLTGLSTYSISNGTSNVNISTSSGNIQLVVAGNSVANITGTGANISGTLSASGALTIGATALIFGNITSFGNYSSSGNITGGNLIGGNGLIAGGNANLANLSASGFLGVTGNANIGNIGTGGLITATGNIRGANLVTPGVLSVTGNANIGNIGTAIITATGNITGANLVTGGLLTVTGNANVGNIGATTAIVTTGNITTINSGLLQNGNSNVTITANGNVTINAVGGARIVATSTGANITGTLSASGNANVGNIGTGIITATGNVTASFFIGNGSQLTGLGGGTSISNGTSNVTISASGGNVTTGVGGTGNVMIVTSTGANVSGTISASGNITAGNFIATGSSGNITGANVIFANSVTTTGNVSSGGLSSPNILLSNFGAANAAVVALGDANTGLFRPAANTLGFTTAGVQRMSINAGAPILALSGGNTSATGTGIAFPATQSASADPNTLDDYEEGIFTPTFASTSGTITSYTGSGFYTKIGRSVNIIVRMFITTAGTAAGQGTISGLPFTNSSAFQVTGLMREGGVTGNTVQLVISASASTGQIQSMTGGNIAWGNSYDYVCSMTYFTAT